MTRDPAFETLSARVLEGLASAEERARFERMLAGDPALRADHEAALAAVVALRTAGLEPAPADLRDAIMRQVRTHAVPAGRRRPPMTFDWRRMLLPATAGLAAGILLWGGLTGTLGVRAPDGTTGAIGARESAPEIVLGDDASGLIVRTTGEGLQLEARGGAAAVVLESPGTGATFGAGGGQSRLALTLDAGQPQAIRVHARAPHPLVQVSVTQAGVARVVGVRL